MQNCNTEYSILNQLQTSHGYNWQPFNSTYSPSKSLSNIYQAFQFTKSNQINSYPYSGLVNTYFGGGYVFKCQDNYSNSLNSLKEYNWIDKQTAAIFIEFTLFNPNVNLFQSCLILFEILPSGNMINSAQFTSLDIMDINNSGLLSFKIIMNIIFMIFIGIFMFDEIRLLAKSGFKYFLDLYNYIDLSIIAFSWTAFSMFLYRLHSSNAIYKQIQQEKNNFVNLQYISQVDQLLSYFLGLCAGLASLRFIKLLRFNKRIIVFLNGFKRSLKELSSFLIIFIVCWMSFVQMFYILLNNQYLEFSSIQNSMGTSFKMILGQDANLFINSSAFNSVLLPCLYVLFVVCMIFVMINVFLTIINDNYALALSDTQLDKEDPEFFNYLKSILMPIFFCFNQQKDVSMSNNDYKDTMDKLPNKFDGFLTRLDRVNI